MALRHFKVPRRMEEEQRSGLSCLLQGFLSELGPPPSDNTSHLPPLRSLILYVPVLRIWGRMEAGSKRLGEKRKRERNKCYSATSTDQGASPRKLIAAEPEQGSCLLNPLHPCVRSKDFLFTFLPFKNFNVCPGSRAAS